VHRPDPATPIEETIGALDQLVREGKVRAIGCSNYSPAELDAAKVAADQGKHAYFVTCQDELSLLARGIEKDLLPAMERRGLSLLPYFPLASGLLTGKYRRNAPAPAGARLSYSRDHAADFISARNWTMIEQLADVAERAGCSILELAFGWLLAKPVVASVIAGATKPEQIAQNVAAAERAPSAAAIAEADAATR
jgi:aryl-alcohol dehydrogenase-like predicted oxidoreductase